MLSHIVQRTATQAEQAFLQKIHASAATAVHRWKQGAENALVLWAASLLGFVVVWLVLAWLARKLFNVEYGLHSPAAPWLLGVATPLFAVYAVASSVRWVKGWQDYRPLLRLDIAGALVLEEHYVLTEAKRFQEQEHGGLMYFLRTNEDKVLVLFDRESQDLGIQDDDPLNSSFKPRSELVIVRAPATRFVISKVFSGEVLEAGDPIPLNVAPKQWPKSEAFCGMPWSELEARLGPSKARSSGVAQ